MKIINLYKFLLIIFCVFSSRLLAMEQDSSDSDNNHYKVVKSIKGASGKKILLGAGANEKFIKNGHYVCAERTGRCATMCLYCAYVFCRSDRARNHVCNFHGVDYELSMDYQDLDNLTYTEKCQYPNCDFEFKDPYSFLEHVKTHMEEFKEAYAKKKKVSKKSSERKRKCGPEDRDSDYQESSCPDEESFKQESFDKVSYIDICEKKEKVDDSFSGFFGGFGAEEEAFVLCNLIELGDIKRGVKNKLTCGHCSKIFSEKKLKQEILPHLQVCQAKICRCFEILSAAKNLVGIGQNGLENKRRKLD